MEYYFCLQVRIQVCIVLIAVSIVFLCYFLNTTMESKVSKLSHISSHPVQLNAWFQELNLRGTRSSPVAWCTVRIEFYDNRAVSVCNIDTWIWNRVPRNSLSDRNRWWKQLSADKDRSNVVVESLTLLLRIREVPVSNLCPETGYPDWGLS
jgi:hypothetical protein